MGTNLTVSCQTYTERCGRRFAIDFNGHTVFEAVNCSVITTHLVINQPSSWLRCKVKEGDTWHLVCGRDLKAGLIPSTPDIMQILLENGSRFPTIYWNGSDNHFKPSLRYRRAHGNHAWVLGNIAVVRIGCVFLQEPLEPLISYQFELRVCVSSANCSMWSKPFNITSPGIAPSEKVDVWAVINRSSAREPQNVTVLWKSYRPEYYNGELLYYKLSYKQEGKIQEVICSPELTQQTLQLNVADVNISVVMSYGSSPPAQVNFKRTGKAAPVITNVIPAASGILTLSWNVSHYTEEEQKGILGFVVQWQFNPQHLEWKRFGKDCTFTSLQGMQAGVLYNFSLYAEEANGISHPALVQVYAKQEQPLAGPDVSVTNVGEGQILIQWDELSQEKQRGFITNYTIYFQRHRDKPLETRFTENGQKKKEYPVSSSSVATDAVLMPEVRGEWPDWFQLINSNSNNHYNQETVPYKFPRRLIWELRGPQECFDILVSAWNSAGEGPKGKPTTCCCPSKESNGQPGTDKATVPLLIWDRYSGMNHQLIQCMFYAVDALPAATDHWETSIHTHSRTYTTDNLAYPIPLYRMSLDCGGNRSTQRKPTMMKMCMSIGVSWIFENLPKFDNSNAIKLLKDDSYGPWQPLPGDNDPPLTPIEELSVSWERKDSYPTVLHVTETPPTDPLLIDSPYKPQLLTASQRNEDITETTEEELKEEDQFPFLMSPHHDFTWDLPSIPVVHGRLNSFIAMDGALGSLGNLEDLLVPRQATSDKDGGVNENDMIMGTGDLGHSSFVGQTVLRNDRESCLFNSSPYSPQGLCHNFSVAEEG
ncbi:interleukin-23 receptor [Danio rerio]|uniref:Interleukin-23 receptor n=1 Tax=Danio rerio TaxID=7955 RepID=A8WH98_DANRE|nr:interleukin-23 receptor [Danio rerio]CAJ44287.1 TPA: interleukin 23 receptor [Danio rerio]|eukprot:NP_001106978.1 interleukin 23 receptor [Danio rerio]